MSRYTRYTDEIAEETKLNELLKKKLAESDDRLRLFKSLERTEDPFLDLMRKELLGADAPLAETSLKQLPEELLDIMRFFGNRDRSLAEVGEYLAGRGGRHTKPIRRIIWDYKNEFGVFDNPSRGVYRLNEKGLELLKVYELI